jgi:hypothetical protein
VPDRRERSGTHSTTASGPPPAATVVGAAATTSAAGTTTAPAPSRAFTVAPGNLDGARDVCTLI